MRAQHEADDRQRIVHFLVRRCDEKHGAIEHLDAEDIAGLVSGTLLKTECSRVENHLLACDECRKRALSLQRDFDAGVVPILLGRTVTRHGGGRFVEPRLPRRLTPWLVAIVAGLFAVGLSLGDRIFSSRQSEVPELSWIVRRLGNPRLVSAEGERDRPAEPGAWVERSYRIEMQPGDLIQTLRPDGSIWKLVEGEWTQQDGGGPFSRALFAGVRDSRREINVPEAGGGPSGSRGGDRPHVVHPRKDIHELRPRLRWAGTKAGIPVQIEVFLQNEKQHLFERVFQGSSADWPADVLALLPGVQYRIELRQPPNSGAVPQKEYFKVLGERRRKEIAQRLGLLEGLVGRRPSMLRAEFWRQEGLPAEAREELERLRLQDSENVHLLMHLRAIFATLDLDHEEWRTRRLIEKRR